MGHVHADSEAEHDHEDPGHEQAWSGTVEQAAPSTSRRSVRQQNTARIQNELDAQNRATWLRNTMQAASDVVKNGRIAMIADAQEEYRPALYNLHAWATGKRGNQFIPASERPPLLAVAIKKLEPAIQALRKENAAWLQEYFIEPIENRRFGIEVGAAQERVERSITVDGHVFDANDKGNPGAEAAAMRVALPQLVDSLTTANEVLMRIKDPNINHAIEQLLQEKIPKEHGKIANLVHLHTMLEAMGGFLTISDTDFHKRLGDIKGVFNGINTYAELAKSAVALGGGGVAVAAGVVALAAKASGSAEIALRASGYAKYLATEVSGVVSIIGVVQGLAKIFDSSLSRQERLEAGIDAVTTAAWMAKGKVAVLGPVSIAAVAGYYQFKHALLLYWGSAHGLTTGLMGEAFNTLAMYGEAIATGGDRLLKARDLASKETDDRERSALERVVEQHAESVGNDVDQLLHRTFALSASDRVALAKEPGAFPILRQALEPVRAYKGARTPEAAATAGKAALERLIWIFAHRSEIVLAAARYQDLRAAEAYVRENDRKAEEARKKEGT